jgi:hypothetical protein
MQNPIKAPTKNIIKYAPIQKNKIRLYYYLGSISTILLLFILLSLFYTRSLNQEFIRKTNQVSTAIINEKKVFLRNAIDRTISLIESERAFVEQEHSPQKLSQAQKDNISIQRISNRIRDLRLINEGYIWVNRIIDYRGGEKYAVRQIHPNLPHTEGQWLSTYTTDIKGNRPYEVELNGIKEKGELYFEYFFKKLNSDKIAHKMSYAKLYKPFDWVVATGVYLDDVDELVSSEINKMDDTLRSQRLYTISIAAIALLVSVIILIRFEKQISKLIVSFESDINKYTSGLIAEKEKTQAALAEVKQLEGLLPICANCKKIRDDSGYWNQIEGYIEKHSYARFSHSICPECKEKLYGEELRNLRNKETQTK